MCKFRIFVITFANCRLLVQVDLNQLYDNLDLVGKKN